jgi:hypothetical protein
MGSGKHGRSTQGCARHDGFLEHAYALAARSPMSTLQHAQAERLFGAHGGGLIARAACRLADPNEKRPRETRPPPAGPPALDGGYVEPIGGVMWKPMRMECCVRNCLINRTCDPVGNAAGHGCQQLSHCLTIRRDVSAQIQGQWSTRSIARARGCHSSSSRHLHCASMPASCPGPAQTHRHRGNCGSGRRLKALM